MDLHRIEIGEDIFEVQCPFVGECYIWLILTEFVWKTLCRVLGTSYKVVTDVSGFHAVNCYVP